MFRAISVIAAMTFAASVANAEPLKLTDTQMDTVTAGLTVNGNAILSFVCDEDCFNRGGTEPVMIVIAGENDLATGPQLPFQVHDNGRPGPWNAALQTSGTPAAFANGGPIDHAPLTVFRP